MLKLPTFPYFTIVRMTLNKNAITSKSEKKTSKYYVNCIFGVVFPFPNNSITVPYNLCQIVAAMRKP